MNIKTIEEKAKAYDEALEMAKRVLETDLHESGVWAITKIFPELAESEDERIRKWIIEEFKIHYDFESKSLNPMVEKALAWLEKQKEQKPKNEAEKFFDSAESYNQGFIAGQKKMKEDIEKGFEIGEHSLDYLAGRYAGYTAAKKEQKPVEWSEEDEDKLTDILEMIKYTDALPPTDIPSCTGHLHLSNEYKEKLSSWLKNQLKSLHPQPKQEWSEEDEKMRINILNALTPQLVYSVGKGTYTGTSTYKYDDEIRWLKSLSPQSHWKPSEGQMKALSETIAFAPDTFKPKCTLMTLQNDLEKLMEE